MPILSGPAATLAQLVERSFRKAQVRGSSPRGGFGRPAPWYRAPVRTLPVSTVVLAASLGLCLCGAATGLAGCSGSGPSVSGFGLFDTKRVQLGEIVEIRLPIAPERGEQWRLASYDSAMLRMLERPALVNESERSAYLLIRFEARVQGETEVLLRNAASPTNETRRYVVQIW